MDDLPHGTVSNEYELTNCKYNSISACRHAKSCSIFNQRRLELILESKEIV